MIIACVRVQMCPVVFLSLLGLNLRLKQRTSGTLTGSRLAGCIGNIIIHECVSANQSRWKSLGFATFENPISLCTWVDNVYSFSTSLRKAIDILTSLEEHLGKVWGLKIKESSRACMVCKGNPDRPLDPDLWPLCTSTTVLGHIVQNDGGIRKDWNTTKRAMWRCFWKNSGSKACTRVNSAGKARLLQTTVVSNFLWKISRWPFQKSIAVELDSLQCRMMSFILPCIRGITESIDHYCRRRLRQARNVSQQIGLWSNLWCKRVINWEDHISRGERNNHFCTRLLKFHGRSWLWQQRTDYVPENSQNANGTRNSLFSGRTGTRMNIGRPQPRWQEGAAIARIASESRGISIRGQNARTIGTIIKEAVDAARIFVNTGNVRAMQS